MSATPYYERDGVRRDYQRRYVLYATANGRTPQEQEAHDKDSYAGFIGWIHEQSRLFDPSGRAVLRNDEFGEWLEERFAPFIVERPEVQTGLWDE